MRAEKTQDNNGGVIQAESHRMESVSIVRRFMTIRTEPKLYQVNPRVQLSPLCTVLSWHAEAPITCLQSRVRQLSPREERGRGELSSCSVRSSCTKQVWMRAGANSHGGTGFQLFEVCTLPNSLVRGQDDDVGFTFSKYVRDSKP